MGVTKFRFVHCDFAHLWTLAIEDVAVPNVSNTYSEKCRLNVTPWIGMDGNVNHRVLQDWLKIILTHCLSYPQISLRSLFNRFSYLRPVEIYSIVQVHLFLIH